ncbi:MAG: hypothetical protein IPI34_15185 [bacterium]|nr:hypothetical protein [bacterium]
MTADRLDELYLGLLRDYWGPEVVLDEIFSARTWSRASRILQLRLVRDGVLGLDGPGPARDGGSGAAEREDYLGFLKSGCSRHPVETLLRTGVDVTTDEPVRDVFGFSVR